MIAYMTYWSAPQRVHSPGKDAMWSLSTLRLRRLVDAGQFRELVLSTDSEGEAWARDLNLPFNRIETWLDKAHLLRDPAMVAMWSMGKLVTYITASTARTPWVHVDGDLMLKRELPAHIMAADYFTERAEFWCAASGTAWQTGARLTEYALPQHWKEAIANRVKLSWQMGMIGGQNFVALGNAAERAIHHAYLNRAAGGEGGWMTVFFEQWGMARELEPWRMATLLPAGDLAAPAAGRDIHHYAGTLKDAKHVQAKIAATLSVEWPEQAARLSPKS